MLRREIEEMKKNVKVSTTIAMWFCTLVAVALLVASWIVPPTGQIDPTALKGASLIFAFASLAVVREAIKEGLGIKLQHNDTTIEIEND